MLTYIRTYVHFYTYIILHHVRFDACSNDSVLFFSMESSHMYIYIYIMYIIYICVCIIYICIHVCMYVYTYVCMYACMCISTRHHQRVKAFDYTLWSSQSKQKRHTWNHSSPVDCPNIHTYIYTLSHIHTYIEQSLACRGRRYRDLRRLFYTC